jgi:hypothetical protein
MCLQVQNKRLLIPCQNEDLYRWMRKESWIMSLLKLKKQGSIFRNRNVEQKENCKEQPQKCALSIQRSATFYICRTSLFIYVERQG